MTETLPDELLEKIPIFQGMSPRERRELVGVAEVCEHAPGEVIVQEGQESQALWVLLQGTCEVFKGRSGKAAAQTPILLATFEPYENFGEMSFFHAAPHSASVRAKSSIKLLKIGRERFDALVLRSSAAPYKLAFNTINSLAERLRYMGGWVTRLLTEKTDGQAVPEIRQLREKLFNTWKL